MLPYPAISMPYSCSELFVIKTPAHDYYHFFILGLCLIATVVGWFDLPSLGSSTQAHLFPLLYASVRAVPIYLWKLDQVPPLNPSQLFLRIRDGSYHRANLDTELLSDHSRHRPLLRFVPSTSPFWEGQWYCTQSKVCSHFGLHRSLSL